VKTNQNSGWMAATKIVVVLQKAGMILLIYVKTIVKLNTKISYNNALLLQCAKCNQDIN